jgi:cold shock CspA family protein
VSDTVFFHRSVIEPDADAIHVRRGAPVAFFYRVGDDGRTTATSVALYPGGEADTKSLENRTVEVSVLPASKSYAFGKDIRTGTHVFVHMNAMMDRAQWRNVAVGSHLQGDIEINSGKLRVVERSAVIVEAPKRPRSNTQR